MAKFFTPTKLSENIRETPEGYLLCLDVPIARTGWQQYARGETPLDVGDDGTVWVHREASEVFRPQTIASYNGKSVTIRHPEDFVGPENWQTLTRGVAQNARRGEEKDEDGEEILFADLLITEAMAIGLVKRGLREVSCGYEAEYEQTGEGEGRQFNIVGNHIALVESGRAGPSYKIKDHKGEGMFEKLKEQLGLLSKTIDQAAALEAKKKKTKDADEESSEKEAKDAGAYDELVKAVKDLSEKVDGMMKGKDEEKEKPAPKKEDKPAAKDEEESEAEDDDQEEMKLEERLKSLEAAVAKLLKMETSENESEDEDEDMSGAEDEEEGEADADESEDEESEKEGKKEKVGDSALAEILAPGVKVTKGEDIKAKALKSAYATDEGKKVIHKLTGGKKPVFDSKEQVEMLFRASAELLKAQRGTGLEGSKDGKKFVRDHEGQAEQMTPEKLNEINAAHWANRK